MLTLSINKSLQSLKDLNSQIASIKSTSDYLSSLNRFTIEIYDNLNLSLIEGEYIESLELILQGLDDLEIELDKTVNQSSETSIESPKILIEVESDEEYADFDIDAFSLNSELLVEFSKHLSTSIKTYRHFIKEYEQTNDYSSNDPEILFLEDYSIPFLNNQWATLIIVQDYSIFFEKNLLLSKIDFKISLNEDLLKELILLKRFFEEQKEEKFYYIQILVEKVNFLIYKVCYRYSQENRRYIVSNRIDMEFVDLESLNIQKLSDFKDIIHSHYVDESQIKGDSIHKKRFTEFKNLPYNSKFSFLSIHVAIKEYKDYSKELSKLIDLKERITEGNIEYNNSLNFDQKAKRILIGYLNNNIISSILENSKNDTSKLTLLETYINENERDNQVTNFFPYYKKLGFIKEAIEQESRKKEVDYEKIEKLKIDFDKFLKEYAEKLNWCSKNNFHTFQLPYKECLVDFVFANYGTIKCFIASSFVLPINYKVYQEKVEEYKSESLLIGSTVRLQERMKELQKLRTEVDNTDKRHIEILSIFSAVVLFGAGNIQLFTKVESSYQAVIFMLLFGYVLGLFVLLIWFITRADAVKFRNLSFMHYIIAALFIFGGCMSFGLIKGWYKIPNSENQNKEKIDYYQFKIDSLKKNHEYDSIFKKTNSDSKQNSTKAKG